MLTSSGHLTYCTNIYAGESWSEHYNALKSSFPLIKAAVSPLNPMGIGLRLSNEASIELFQKANLSEFKEWLQNQQAYVFTMNGFPYGRFHRERVKDQVHSPDWTTEERVQYTVRLFELLEALIPYGMEGGISTSPLSYKLWFKNHELRHEAVNIATRNIIRIVERLIHKFTVNGVVLHLDIEPEPDGLLETGSEFIDWFTDVLLPAAVPVIAANFDVSAERAEELIRQHLRLCYDVCHFAVGYEDHGGVIERLSGLGIKVGKIQISAALKGRMDKREADIEAIKRSFAKYDEPVYLHQVIARSGDGKLVRFPDLSAALKDGGSSSFNEWRAHFHVPVFADHFGLLESTREEIEEVLALQKSAPFTTHLELETYTWEVLPPELKLSLTESIIRELQWAKQLIDS